MEGILGISMVGLPVEERLIVQTLEDPAMESVTLQYAWHRLGYGSLTRLTVRHIFGDCRVKSACWLDAVRDLS